MGGDGSSKAGWLERTGTDEHQLLNSGVIAAVAVTIDSCGWLRSRKLQPWWMCTYARADWRQVWVLKAGYAVQETDGQDDSQGHETQVR